MQKQPSLTETEDSETRSQLPDIEIRRGEQAIVRCKGFRCLAVSDGHGKWVDAKGREIKGFCEVLQRLG